MARHRIFGFAIGVAGLLVTAAQPASAGGGRHPLFNDQGTIDWYSSLDEAQAVARATGKLIFIESGRRACGNCRHMVEEVLPTSPVRPRITNLAIGLADDCDSSDPRVAAMLNAGISDPSILPLCGFVTPELRWVTGFSGYMDPGSFSGHLTLAEERFEKIKKFRHRDAPVTAPCQPTPPAVATVPRPVTPPPRPPIAPPSIGGDGCCPGGVCHLPPPKPAPPSIVPTPVLPPIAKVLPKLIAPTPAPGPIATPPSVAKLLPPPAPVLPAPATAPIAVAPRPVTPARVAPPLVALAPKVEVVVVPKGPMDRARAAAADGRWGDVLKVAQRVADERSPVSTPERSELDALVRRANDWVLGSLDAVVASAKVREFPSARRTLTVLAEQLDGTTCPGLIDAERGTRAVERLSAIEQGSPDQADAPEQLRKTAYSEFRGTRWAPLFRGAVAGK